MNLGFKDQFEAYVQDGTKRHTIRGGDRWKAGMRADLYVRPRQKGMRLLFRATVVRVERIHITDVITEIDCHLCHVPVIEPHEHLAAVYIDDTPLDEDERNVLAWKDGFRNGPGDPLEHHGLGYLGCFRKMMSFWKGRLPFEGQIIHWDYDKRFMEKPVKPRNARRQRKAA